MSGASVVSWLLLRLATDEVLTQSKGKIRFAFEHECRLVFDSVIFWLDFSYFRSFQMKLNSIKFKP